MPRIRGEALRTLVQTVPSWDTGPYEDIAWAAFRKIRSEGNTVEFPDILVTLDTLRGIDTEMSRSLRRVTALAERARAVRPSTAAPSAPSPVTTLIAPDPPSRGLSLLATLGDEARIRFYVETGSNKGHQSATVTVARKLLAWMRSPLRSQNLNLDLVLEFVCNDQDALEKASSIIGGATLDGVRVSLVRWPTGFSSLSRCRYAFSGAIDRPEVTSPKLNADYVVALQPYGWKGGAEGIFCGERAAFVLTRGGGPTAPAVTTCDAVPLPMPFRRLPFTESASASSSSSETATSMPDRIVTSLLDAVRESSSSDAPILLCPIYGMGAGQPMSAHTEAVWNNVGRALMELNRQCGARVLLLNVSLDMGESPSGAWARVRTSFPTAEVFTDAITSLDTAARVLEAARAKPLTVCTVTGSKSQWVMDRVYRESQLPPIFEGQGSLTQVLCMGRPFIKLSLRAWVDTADWLSDYLPAPGYDTVDEELQKVANSIIERSGDADERARKMAELMREMVKPGSLLCHYFEQVRRVVTCPSYDRLAWAMEALAEVRSRGA
jgi:hypothetical protein